MSEGVVLVFLLSEHEGLCQSVHSRSKHFFNSGVGPIQVINDKWVDTTTESLWKQAHNAHTLRSTKGYRRMHIPSQRYIVSLQLPDDHRCLPPQPTGVAILQHACLSHAW